MIMTNPEHIPTNDAMNNDLPNPTGVSNLNTPLYLWDHLFADQRGYLALFSGARGDDPRKLLACTERYFSWPDEAGPAVECALAESNRGRESYFCAHLLTEKRRIKENAAPFRALYVDGDGAFPGEGLPLPTAIIESSPGRLQMWWRLDSEVPPETGEDLNRRLAYAMGADKSGWDLTQLLRVPGTKNHKYPERPTVRFIGVEEESYSPAEMDRALPPAPNQTRNGHHINRDPDQPPVELGAEGLRVFRGEVPKVKAEGTGEVDRSATLMKIGRVLYDAGANRPALAAALRERDFALYKKYTNNRDGGEREYHRIVDKLEEEGRNTTVKWRSDSSREDKSKIASGSGVLEGKGNQADRLVGYALESGAELFMDHLGSPHVLVEGEAIMLSSRSHNWLRGLLWEAEGRSVSAEALKTAAGTLAAFAAASGKVHELHTRSAYSGGAVYYQLDKGRVVEVDRNGWRWVDDPPVIFRSIPNLKPLPDPERGGSLDVLEELINLKSDRDKRMLRAYTVTVPLPHIPRPMLQTTGAMGSGKTTAGRVVKRLLDPSVPETVRADGREFLQKASHSYIVMLDNLNSLPEWMVDTLCRLVTGDGDSKRALYTDDEDFIYQLKRAILLNGINAPTAHGDAQDRTLPVELERIPDNIRRSEEELWAAFKAEHPRILGAVFSALSETIRVRETLELPRRPRLADWGYYAASAYVAFGWGRDRFLKDWGNVVRVQNQGTLDGSPVAQALIEFMEHRDRWDGLATELHKELKTVAEDLGIDVQRDKMWPKSPLWLSRRLKEVIPLLTAMGVNVEVPNKRKKGTMVILTKGSPSKSNGGSKGGSNNEGGSKKGDTATEDPAQVSQPNPQAPNGGSRGSKVGCSYKPKPQDNKEAKTGLSPVDDPEKGAEDTPFPGLFKNTASTATRTCPHSEDEHTDEEWEEF
jgi:hypothetical protein